MGRVIVISHDSGDALSNGRSFHRRVLVVSHYASERTGGAGSIPLRLFGRLRSRGVDAWLLTHDSGRDELRQLLPPAEFDRVIFARGLPGLRPVFVLGERLPPGLRSIAWAITQMERQVAMVPVVRRLVRELGVDVVHQPISVSPVVPSPLSNVGAPVVMGPLNGGMELPPGLRDRDSLMYSAAKAARPLLAATLNRIVRGRPNAAAVLVANERTRSLLPRSVRERAVEVSEIGVVLDDWPAPEHRLVSGEPVRFLFVGRLVPLKGVDILLDAFALARASIPGRLEIVGDGPERARLAEKASRLACAADVSLTGWLDQQDCGNRIRDCDVFISPSLHEAGGLAVIEAMSCARPVIATAWGGHLGTIDEEVGILVGVSSREAMVRELADAMVSLARDPGRRARLGSAGRHRVETRYDWNVLIDTTLSIYEKACSATSAARVPSAS